MCNQPCPCCGHDQVAVPSDREKRLEEALRNIIMADTSQIMHCKIAIGEIPNYESVYGICAEIARAALAPEPWGGPDGEEE